MKQVSTALAGLLCIAASGAAFAQKRIDTVPVKDADKADAITGTSLLSYTFANLSYMRTEIGNDNGEDLTADGFGLSGSFLLPANLLPVLSSLYATAGYSTQETDDFTFGGATGTFDLVEYRFGLGYRLPLSNVLDVNAEVDFLQQEVKGNGDFDGAEDDESGFRIGALGRYSIMPQLEVGGGVRYVDVGEDSETGFEVNGVYHIARGFSALLSAGLVDDDTTYGLGGRYNFGF